MLRWKFYQPIFECDLDEPRIQHHSTWVGHRKFVYDLVRFQKPNTIVELGTQWGTSFFSMCQAAKDGRLSSKCYAIDTWLGDPQTGYYEETVYSTVKKISSRRYPNIAYLIRGPFDDAVAKFPDQKIDLLHIDGFHAYESVSHDYHNWLPKVAGNGIILFHDIAVRHDGFGVWKLWNELKSQHPAYEFAHSCGLGILFPKGCSQPFRQAFHKWDDFRQNYSKK